MQGTPSVQQASGAARHKFLFLVRRMPKLKPTSNSNYSIVTLINKPSDSICPTGFEISHGVTSSDEDPDHRPQPTYIYNAKAYLVSGRSWNQIVDWQAPPPIRGLNPPSGLQPLRSAVWICYKCSLGWELGKCSTPDRPSNPASCSWVTIARIYNSDILHMPE